MVERLGLNETEARSVILAASWHDKGKDRQMWQISIGNTAYPDIVLAKSAQKMLPFQLNHYRHEFGSILDVCNPSQTPEFESLPEEVKDLLLHLIAAHHGRARPHFPIDESYDPNLDWDTDASELALETPRRYARLQRKYGRWGLAYLESLVRAADRAASQPIEPDADAPPPQEETVV